MIKGSLPNLESFLGELEKFKQGEKCGDFFMNLNSLSCYISFEVCSITCSLSSARDINVPMTSSSSGDPTNIPSFAFLSFSMRATTAFTRASSFFMAFSLLSPIPPTPLPLKPLRAQFKGFGR